MKKIIFICSLLSIFTIGCNRKNIIKESVTKIEVPDKMDDKYLVDNSLIIKLETTENNLIGYIVDVKIYDNTIYVLDQFRKRIYLFDMNGKYKGKVDNLGKGPNEYLRIKDFNIYENEIFLLSLNKIVIFDISTLEAKREVKLKEIFPYSLMVGKKNLILSTNNFPSKYILNYISKDDLKITSYLQSEIKSKDNELGLPLGGYMFHPIPNEDKSIFHFTFSSNIYTVSDDGYECTYEIDLKNNGIPESILLKGPHVIKEYMDHKQYMRIYKAFQIKNTLLITLDSRIKKHEDGKAYLIRTKDRTSYYNSIFEKTTGMKLTIIGTSSEGFLGFISTEYLINRKKELLKKNTKELSPFEETFLSEFKENSNPYLVIFKIIL